MNQIDGLWIPFHSMKSISVVKSTLALSSIFSSVWLTIASVVAVNFQCYCNSFKSLKTTSSWNQSPRISSTGTNGILQYSIRWVDIFQHQIMFWYFPGKFSNFLWVVRRIFQESSALMLVHRIFQESSAIFYELFVEFSRKVQHLCLFIHLSNLHIKD